MAKKNVEKVVEENRAGVLPASGESAGSDLRALHGEQPSREKHSCRESSKGQGKGTGRVLIFQAFQLFSSSVQFCDRSRLPYPCRPESRKRNTCEPASAFCSPCRSILPCRQVRQVTNIYVLSFCVSSLSSIFVLLAGRTAFLLSCSIAPQSGHRSGSFSAEKQ